ncbi:MAG: hypothetical protein ACFFDU_08910 [Candidatus Thorarchaeota archaeon]
MVAMRWIDIVCPLFLMAIALLVIWFLVLINPVILPFAIGFGILLFIFILASFCSGRYTHEDGSDQAYKFKR